MPSHAEPGHEAGAALSDQDKHTPTHGESSEDRRREADERHARYARRAEELQAQRRIQDARAAAEQPPDDAPPRKPMGWGFPIMWLLIGIACFIPGYFIQKGADRDVAQLTAQVEGTILNDAHTERSSNCRHGSSCSTNYSCEFSYQFSPKDAATGEDYRGEGSDHGRCGDDQSEGTARTVYYDPDDPEHSTIEDPGSFFERYIGLLVLMIPGGICIIYAVVRSGLNVVRRATYRRS
jgi:hypothetical protein